MNKTKLKQNPIRRNAMRTLISMMLLLGVAGCQKEIPGRSINHNVIVWFKDSKDMQLIAKVMQETLKLSEIPEARNIHVGRPVASERSIVDSSFDLGISMQFDNKEAMDRYLNDPRHKEFFKKYIEGNTSKIIVYDF